MNLSKIFQKLGLRRDYRNIDRIHYLKRLASRRKDSDTSYVSAKDRDQFDPGAEILIQASFDGQPVFFKCNPGIHIERQIILKGLYAQDLLHHMATLATPGEIIIDVGSNVGALAIPLAKAGRFEVHAFEPNEHAYTRFHANLRLNKIENLSFHPVAVGARPGMLPLRAFSSTEIGMSSFVESTDTMRPDEIREVPVVTLDDQFRGRAVKVSVIKIDVQGFEKEVLAGAEEIVASDRPSVLLEHEDRNFPSAAAAHEAKVALAEFFERHAYQVYYVTRKDPQMLLPVKWDRPLSGDLLALP